MEMIAVRMPVRVLRSTINDATGCTVPVPILDANVKEHGLESIVASEQTCLSSVYMFVVLT